MSLSVGEIIEGKYRIVRLVGEGGMGAVYEGENVRIGRRVAIKILHAGLTENAEVVTRFEQEARAAGRIGNDHILEVLDMGALASGDRFIVMEFLDGEPLSDRIKNLRRMAPAHVAPLIQQVLVGLAAAHRAGIVHRDLKPDNVFILREKAGHKDYVKIIDFGISKFQPLGGDGMKMTRTGAVMGTPHYMSPEQASGSRETDQRSDIYAIGVILYEAVTGSVPFDAPTFNQLLFKIVLADVPSPLNAVPDLDPAFASIVSKAMAREPEQRFQSCDEFLAALAGWASSGAAVSVPPPADPRAMLPTSAPRSAAPSTSPTPASMRSSATAGTWSTSQSGVPKRGALPLAFGIAGAVIVMGGFVAVAFTRHSNPETAASAAAPGRAPATPSAVVAPTPTPRHMTIVTAAAPSSASADATALAPPIGADSAAPAKVPAARSPASRFGAAKSTAKSKADASSAPKSAGAAAPDFGY